VFRLLSDPHRKEEIFGRLARIRPDSPRRWGRMNALQMICHLSDSILSVMGEKPVEIPARYPWRRLMKWGGLYVPTPWPKGVPTMPEIDAEIGGTPPSDFEADKSRVVALIDRFTQKPRSFEFRPHPIFLELSEREWMRWGYLHLDHHLRQFGQ
jgi:hypothetical protein